ncbi:hypothetical protein Hypma_007202 [Hypsizygus marmoreus]|uniref:Uncharacterized protein n=1 Tax=Hypsizygus marmoreus TaxID=39966 RepID=A0A369KF53_HYPMA|nr:hypothetical protein Hypma_007202 [Hypsizygus marmoreus]
MDLEHYQQLELADNLLSDEEHARLDAEVMAQLIVIFPPRNPPREFIYDENNMCFPWMVFNEVIIHSSNTLDPRFQSIMLFREKIFSPQIVQLASDCFRSESFKTIRNLRILRMDNHGEALD